MTDTTIRQIQQQFSHTLNMPIDPPARHHQPKPNIKDPTTPHPFEIAFIRKLESKTKTIRDAFLLLDVNGDGHISPEDIKTVLHNEFGMDISQEQEQYIFSRFSAHKDGRGVSCDNAIIGMSFGQFAKYFNDVSNATLPTSKSGFAAAVGFHINEGNKSVDHEIPIHETTEMKRLKLRHQLRQTLSAHSSRTHGGSGMKETSLYLAIDIHRSGKVTMTEFLDWLKSVGVEWDMEQLKLVVLGCPSNDAERKLEHHFFGTDNDGLEGGKEAGMAEHEFAEFVESLDLDSIVVEAHSEIKDQQDQKSVVMID